MLARTFNWIKMEPGGWTHATWVAIKVTMCRSCRDSEIMFARKETDDDHEAIGGGGGHVGGAMGRMSTLGVVPGNDGIRRARDAIEQFFLCYDNCKAKKIRFKKRTDTHELLGCQFLCCN